MLRVLLVFGIVMISIAIVLPVQAENNQTVVIGGGVGSYNFNNADLGSINNLVYGTEFIEWYAFEEIGFGIRSHKFYQTDTSGEDEKILMATVNLAAIWVIFGASDSLRMAVSAGYGPGGANYTNDVAQIDVSVTGNTNSYGLFFDWGGERWGVRLGYHQVFANFDFEDGPISGTIEGSGNSASVAVRLAF